MAFIINLKKSFSKADLPVDNQWGIPQVNKKVPGKFKDELCGKIMTEFVSLKSKVYGFKIDGKDSSVRKLKGVGKTAIKHITFDDFYKCLFNEVNQNCTFNTIQSKNHQVFTVKIHKKALDSSDNKRYILPNNVVETLPWGHYKIVNE